MGRPSLGDRTQINLRLPSSVIAEMDAARGHTPRNAWIEKAIGVALRPSARIVEEAVHQPAHTHRYATLIGSRWVAGVKYRISRCACGETIEEKL